MRDNEITDNLRNGILVSTLDADPEPANNLIVENELEGNGAGDPSFNDITDTTTGAGTKGTNNTYEENECDTSSPVSLCD